MAQGRYTDAEPLMVAAAGGLRPIAGVEDRERAANAARLAALHRALGRPAEAHAQR
jgi:hypothetical protein